MLTPNIKFSSLGSFNALRNKKSAKKGWILMGKKGILSVLVIFIFFVLILSKDHIFYKSLAGKNLIRKGKFLNNDGVKKIYK